MGSHDTYSVTRRLQMTVVIGLGRQLPNGMVVKRYSNDGAGGAHYHFYLKFVHMKVG